MVITFNFIYLYFVLDFFYFVLYQFYFLFYQFCFVFYYFHFVFYQLYFVSTNFYFVLFNCFTSLFKRYFLQAQKNSFMNTQIHSEIRRMFDTYLSTHSNISVCYLGYVGWYECNCCPYGYHIDLDFVRYCESIERQSECTGSIKRRKDRRRQRQSMEVLLGLTPPPPLLSELEQAHCQVR